MPAKRKASSRNKVADAKKNNPSRNHVADARKNTSSSSHLIMYYGNGCPHCDNMDDTVKKLEQKLHVTVIKKETWHNDENAEELSKVDNGKCGGVPFFWNSKNKKWLCGECDYDELEKWAQ